MKETPLRIALTDTMGSQDKFQRYVTWLLGGGGGIAYEVLSCERAHAGLPGDCAGLLLTGGGDVDPRLYGGQADHAKLSGVNRKRDDFERALIDEALARPVPLLGVCRGMQLVNVHFGGTLHEDLAGAGFPSHDSREGEENRHALTVEPESLLARAAGETGGNVNSYHHQGAAEPGRGLRVVARSPDGLPEAMEMTGISGGRFFLLVQWHPERMRDSKNPFSKNIVQSFLSSLTDRTKE